MHGPCDQSRSESLHQLFQRAQSQILRSWCHHLVLCTLQPFRGDGRSDGDVVVPCGSRAVSRLSCPLGPSKASLFSAPSLVSEPLPHRHCLRMVRWEPLPDESGHRPPSPLGSLTHGHFVLAIPAATDDASRQCRGAAWRAVWCGEQSGVASSGVECAQRRHPHAHAVSLMSLMEVRPVGALTIWRQVVARHR